MSYTIGTLSAEGFTERFISAADLVMDEGNTALADEEFEMMVILRIDRKFVQFMHAKYAHFQHETFTRTVLCLDDNESYSEVDFWVGKRTRRDRNDVFGRRNQILVANEI